MSEERVVCMTEADFRGFLGLAVAQGLSVAGKLVESKGAGGGECHEELNEYVDVLVQLAVDRSCKEACGACSSC